MPAPLHNLFRQRPWAKDTANCWNKLQKGDYDWAHLAHTIWPDRVRDACRKDRSIAIAHGLEEPLCCNGSASERARQPARSDNGSGLMTFSSFLRKRLGAVVNECRIVVWYDGEEYFKGFAAGTRRTGLRGAFDRRFRPQDAPPGGRGLSADERVRGPGGTRSLPAHIHSSSSGHDRGREDAGPPSRSMRWRARLSATPRIRESSR